MKPWRVLLTLSFLLLGGCLVTFDDPLPGAQTAPQALLGQWSSKDAWGEPLKLTISHTAGTAYKAVAQSPNNPAQSYSFRVVQHGSRWYLSAAVPKEMGGHYLIGGFELTPGKELVVYTLDVEQIRQAVEHQELSGRRSEVPEDNGQGMHVDSPPARVLAYLDDPANSDLFVEVARFQRAGK